MFYFVLSFIVKIKKLGKKFGNKIGNEIGNVIDNTTTTYKIIFKFR